MRFGAIYLSFLALPLAFVGVPIYLNIADFYVRNFGLSLALIGALLVVIRIIDAVFDPIIGHFSDKLAQNNFGHKLLIYVASFFLSLSFYLVFNPPKNLDHILAIIWFFCSLTATYFFFNITIINFESIIALKAKNDEERLKINSIKEFFGIIGMILAFLIPTILTKFLEIDQGSSYLILSICFAILILIAVGGFLKRIHIEEKRSEIKLEKRGFYEVLKDKKFLTLLLIFLINGIAVSLPAANLNFYVRDVLGREEELGWFLTVYFLSSCLFMPIWGIILAKIGVIKVWIVSILGSVITFAFIYFLRPENANYFYLICFFAGLFLGPDLILPPTLLAKITKKNQELTSSYFSLWNFITKMSLMLASSISFIALDFAGYSPGKLSNSFSPQIIVFFYALLPCCIKLVTIFLLIIFSKKILSHENN